MSRWNSQFKEHAFQEVWTTILANLENIEIDDEADVALFEELARLKKIVTYIDGGLKLLDVELIPQTIWDNFGSNINHVNTEVGQCVSNPVQPMLSQTNASVDACLAIIQPYIVNCDATFPLTESVRKSVEVMAGYTDTFSEKSDKIIAEITAKQESIEGISALVTTKQAEITGFSSSLFGDGATQGIKDEIEELKLAFEQNKAKIESFYNETFVDNDGESNSTKSQILEYKNSSESDAEQIREFVEEVSGEVDNLKIFYNKIYGEIPKGEIERQGGLDSFLKFQKKELTNFQAEQKTRYKALNTEIETLLPGATSAGLAVAYMKMKDTFESKIKHSSNVFYLSLALLFFVSLILTVESIKLWEITFVKIDGYETIFKGLMSKLPFYGPVVWLAYYATARRSEYERLQQEYAHKEALARSYNSYKKQLQDLGDEDNIMQKDLITKAIDAIAFNASETLDKKHGDKMPSHDLLEKVVKTVIAKIENK